MLRGPGTPPSMMNLKNWREVSGIIKHRVVALIKIIVGNLHKHVKKSSKNFSQGTKAFAYFCA